MAKASDFEEGDIVSIRRGKRGESREDAIVLETDIPKNLLKLKLVRGGFLWISAGKVILVKDVQGDERWLEAR